MASLIPYNGSLTRLQAKHLISRTKIGYTRIEVDQITGSNASTVIDSLFNDAETTVPPPLDPETGTTWVYDPRNHETSSSNNVLKRSFKAWWCDLMVNDNSIMEKLVLFMHTNIPTSDKAYFGQMELSFHQLQLFRIYALGNFKTMCRKLLKDIAINKYLSGFSNREGSVNENLGREFLELFTIGKGSYNGILNYTEDDVIQAARILSGAQSDSDAYRVDADTGLFTCHYTERRHDSEDKQFSASFNNTLIVGRETEADIEEELDEFVDMIFAKRATAIHMARRMYRFFISTTISQEVESDIIEPLATTIIENNYVLEPAYKQLLKSRHFFAEDGTTQNNIIGAMINSPQELIYNMVKQFNMYIHDKSNLTNWVDAMQRINQFVEDNDMSLFNPNDVAGWSAYYQEPDYDKTWISSTTIVNRYDAVERLIRGRRKDGLLLVQLQPLAYCENSSYVSNPQDPVMLIKELTDYYFIWPPSAERLASFKVFLVDEGFPDYYWTSEWYGYVNSGDDRVVKPRLESLFKAILESPEAQVK